MCARLDSAYEVTGVRRAGEGRRTRMLPLRPTPEPAPPSRGGRLFIVWLTGLLAIIGRNEVSQGTPPIPEEAIESSKEDVEWLKTQARSARP